MNKIYESATRIVHDDREFITPEQAFDILWNGKSILVCEPPDYGAENEWQIFSMPYPVWINDVATPGTLDRLTDEKRREIVFEYLRGYELSR